MSHRLLLVSAAALLAVGIGSGTAHAQFEGEMARLHAACNSGDKGACIRLGSALHEHRDHESDWRRSHAEWYQWEHR